MTIPARVSLDSISTSCYKLYTLLSMVLTETGDVGDINIDDEGMINSPKLGHIVWNIFLAL